MTNKENAGYTPGLDLDHPLSVYIHVPFCVRKCPYCAFVSHVPKAGELQAFPALIDRELALCRTPRGSGKIPVDTLYIGGGTPSCLSPETWGGLIRVLESHFRFLPGHEISVEANPDSLQKGHLSLWKEWGINRISLGVQSLDDDELRWLERPHDARKAMASISAVLASGIDLSVDLMFGLAGQTLRGWHRDMRYLLDTGLAHISLYQLTLEEGSRWQEGIPGQMTEGYPFYRWAQWYLPHRGYDQYEIASFARDRKWCRHNLAYWYGRDVLALGPGAWGYADGTRYWNHPDPIVYREKLLTGRSPVEGREHLPPERSFREAAVIALRTRWGIPLKAFRRRYGYNATYEVLDILRSFPRPFFHHRGSHIALSPRGMRVANAIWEALL